MKSRCKPKAVRVVAHAPPDEICLTWMRLSGACIVAEIIEPTDIEARNSIRGFSVNSVNQLQRHVMGKNEKLTPSSKRVGTSALIVAASLLGIALGASDAMAGKAHGTAPPSHSSDKLAPPQSTPKTKRPYLVFTFKQVAVKTVSAKKPSNPHTNVAEPVGVGGKK